MLSQLVPRVDAPRVTMHETGLNPVLGDDRASEVVDLVVTVTRAAGPSRYAYRGLERR